MKKRQSRRRDERRFAENNAVLAKVETENKERGPREREARRGEVRDAAEGAEGGAGEVGFGDVAFQESCKGERADQ